jgi:hypothetical protein
LWRPTSSRSGSRLDPSSTFAPREAVSFFTDITYRLGIPNTLITDNGT